MPLPMPEVCNKGPLFMKIHYTISKQVDGWHDQWTGGGLNDMIYVNQVILCQSVMSTIHMYSMGVKLLMQHVYHEENTTYKAVMYEDLCIRLLHLHSWIKDLACLHFFTFTSYRRCSTQGYTVVRYFLALFCILHSCRNILAYCILLHLRHEEDATYKAVMYENSWIILQLDSRMKILHLKNPQV